MSAKSKRPSVMDLGSLMVTPPAAADHVTEERRDPEPAAVSPRPAKIVAKAEPQMFRTSVYFSRAVHDKLRAIAFEERKSVTDLINEGLDHVLASRNYPTTSELKDRKR